MPSIKPNNRRIKDVYKRQGKDNRTGSHGALHSATGTLIEEKHFGKEMSYKDARCMVIDEVALMLSLIHI